MRAQYNPTPIIDRRRSETVRVVATPDQTWAIDALWLYNRLEVLRPVGRHYVNRIRLFDLASDVLLVLGMVATFFWAWWAGAVLIGFACLQRHANRRMAGELAAKAAQESSDAFLYLYNRGALWLDSNNR